MEFEIVAKGFCFLEAPRADGADLWFSDLLLGGLRRLSPDGAIAEFLPDRKRIGGALINEDGTIICGGTGGLAWLEPASGRSGMLLEVADGTPISSVNDMYPDGKGGLYFGTSTSALREKGGPPLPTAIYRLSPDGKVTLVLKGLKFSNGIGLSPDGRRLYHNESLVGTFAYDVLADGSLANPILFSAKADCDGLAVDAEGGVWIACFASGEIIRLLPSGVLDRRVPLPLKNVTSLCFGGEDWRDLYVATAGNEGIDALVEHRLPPREACLYRARSEVPGLPVPRTRFSIPAAGRPR